MGFISRSLSKRFKYGLKLVFLTHFVFGRAVLGPDFLEQPEIAHIGD
jgi:hypothetical protein